GRRRRRMVHGDDALRFGEGKRPQQHGVDYAENRRVRPDTQREDGQCRDRKAGILAKHAQRLNDGRKKAHGRKSRTATGLPTMGALSINHLLLQFPSMVSVRGTPGTRTDTAPSTESLAGFPKPTRNSRMSPDCQSTIERSPDRISPCC